MNSELWILLLYVVGIAFGVNEEGVKTVKFKPVDPVDNLDKTWYRSIKTWYSPLSHKLDIYRMSRELLELTAEEIPEHDIYYEACITYHPTTEENPPGYNVKGFGGLTSFVRTLETEPWAKRIESDYKYGAKGNGTIIQTDNKSYILNVICDRNALVWNVWSVTPTLDDKMVSRVFAKTQQLGFYRENFVMIKYDVCKKL